MPLPIADHDASAEYPQAATGEGVLEFQSLRGCVPAGCGGRQEENRARRQEAPRIAEDCGADNPGDGRQCRQKHV
jgi:hypothetical protein